MTGFRGKNNYDFLKTNMSMKSSKRSIQKINKIFKTKQNKNKTSFTTSDKRIP